MWQKSEILQVNSRGVLFLGKNGKFYKWRDTNSERGGEEGIENQNLQSFQVALRLLSGCSHLALKLLFFRDGSIMRDIDIRDSSRRDPLGKRKGVWQTGMVE